MTNFEWLLKNKQGIIKHALAKDCLIALKKSNEVTFCKGLDCTDCDFHDGIHECRINCEKWLDAEHIEAMIPLDTPVDTKVLVCDDNSTWRKRHLAGIKFIGDSYEYVTYDNGLTSWTACGEKTKTKWRYCKLADGNATE